MTCWFSPEQVHVLHGLQSADLQRRVFRRTQPGEWKIVLTTNIGMMRENDCVFVLAMVVAVLTAVVAASQPTAVEF